jgi:hypothetical protein
VIPVLAFVWESLTSAHGLCVAVLFAIAVWTWVGITKLADRRAERAHLEELNAMLAGMPTRPEKTLMPPEVHRAA